MRLRARSRVVEFPRRPLIMGIVNFSDDSFSGDGSQDLERQIALARSMVAAGADIIDVGAESARTNRQAIAPAEEIGRLAPFVRCFADEVAPVPPADATQLWPPLLSLNTWRSEVVSETLAIGGDLLNDIGGLPDASNAQLCALHGAALLVMHSVGAPKVPHLGERYDDIWATLDAFFEEKIALARSAGVAADQIVLDPGIDFAKQRDDNLSIFRHLDRLSRFGRPILLPVSRKSVIGEVLGIPDPADRDAGTVASLVSGALRGAHIFRVHHVAAARQALQVLDALRTPDAPGAKR